MIVYKDKTWCTYGPVCGTKTCDRRLTEKDIEDAKKWCACEHPPLSVADMREVCKSFTPIVEKEDKIE